VEGSTCFQGGSAGVATVTGEGQGGGPVATSCSNGGSGVVGGPVGAAPVLGNGSAGSVAGGRGWRLRRNIPDPGPRWGRGRQRLVWGRRGSRGAVSRPARAVKEAVRAPATAAKATLPKISVTEDWGPIGHGVDGHETLPLLTTGGGSRRSAQTPSGSRAPARPVTR
jgi:hypothetical protein